MNYKLEICANSATSCVEAQNGGAYRVELCAAIPEGGTTPSYGEIAVARELINIKLNVIIRPRGGDFLYSEIEHKAIMELLNCKQEDDKLKGFSDDELKQELDRRQNACK